MTTPPSRMQAGSSDRPFAELDELLEALVEQRASAPQMARMEQIVLADKAALRRYLDYVALHGSLLWDTAQSGELVQPAELSLPAATAMALRPAAAVKSPARRRLWTAAVAVAAVCVTALAAVGFRDSWNDSGPAVATTNPVATAPDGSGDDMSAGSPKTTTSGTPDNSRHSAGEPQKKSPHNLLAHGANSPAAGTGSTTHGRTDNDDGGADSVAKASPSTGQAHDKVRNPVDSPSHTAPGASLGTVAFVDDQLRTSWEASDVAPSPVAEDSEWLRRVHLDVVGRIPSADVVESFLKDRSPTKRQEMVDRLLDDPLFVRHWTTVWTNLLIGRTSSRDELRPGLQKYLRERFAHNQRWDETVAELVSAEGTPEENGATGFLLAHLNNEAVPATAITAKLFLGVQLQCTQCHSHPFHDATQNQFWEFNSFFTQTARVDRQQIDPKTGQTVRQVSLVNQERGGPIFYETRGAVMRAAFPRFGGEQIDNGPKVNRRQELARLMLEAGDGQVARAMVNRTWEQFLGAGFTRSVDDMGPHSPPTHPAALERLADDFEKSGYDVKQLIRWICATDAYQRSSRFSGNNADDDPSIGNPPLFSRVYVKSMTAEQLYDSLLVATRADDTPRAARTDLDRQRHDWIQQFVVSFDTEENDEAMTFNGTIPQALMMMNGEMVSAAVSDSRGTFVDRLARDDTSDVEKIRRLTLAALSRPPSPKELTSLRKMLRDRAVKKPRATLAEAHLAEGLEDVFWALLNSNEFVLVH